MSLIVPLLSVIAIWWIGTGVVLYLQQRLTSTRLVLASTLLCVSLLTLIILKIVAHDVSSWNSYAGFVAAVVLWGCIELSYYSGLVSGVHQRECPPHCSTYRRFQLALGASIWHEISVLFAGLIVVTLHWSEPNPTGLYTFLVLWMMRWSAKLNLFFGVPNFNTDWFPARLAYAHSYIRRAPVSVFYVVCVSIACVVAWKLLSLSLQQPSPLSLTSGLPGVLLMLAILEHFFMALPIADAKLWNRIFARDEPTDQVLSTHSNTGAEQTKDCPAHTAVKPVSVSLNHTPTR